MNYLLTDALVPPFAIPTARYTPHPPIKPPKIGNRFGI